MSVCNDMNNNMYILKSVDDNQYNFILITKDMSRLHDYMSNVERDLKKLKIKCFILFDLLLNNNIDDRFYKCYFDGIKFSLTTLSKVDDREINNNLLEISSLYYLENEYLFEEMLFTKDYKKYIFENLRKSLRQSYI